MFITSFIAWEISLWEMLGIKTAAWLSLTATTRATIILI